MSKQTKIDESWPEDVKDFMTRHSSTWATKTDSYGNVTTYTTPDFVPPEDGVLTPTVRENTPGTL